MKTNNKLKSSIILKYLCVIILLLTISRTGFSQPEEDWVSRYNTLNKDDKVQAMAIDKDGNIYLTGYSEKKESGNDVLTIKYNSAGKEQWISRFAGQENSDNRGNAVAIDEQGNVYVAGSGRTVSSKKDILTIEYNQKGDEIWASYFDGFGSLQESDEEATSITVNAGSIYVAGKTDALGNGYNICLIKYGSRRNTEWVKTMNNLANGDDYAVSVKIDPKGNIIIAGTINGLNSSKDYYTAKFNTLGLQIWEANYNGLGGNDVNNDDELKGLEVDPSGNVYVAGYSHGPGTGKDFLTIKYNSKGETVWTSRYDGSQIQKKSIHDEEATALTIDALRNVYVTGFEIDAAGKKNMLTEKIDANGKKQWTKTYKAEAFGSSENEADAIALNKRGEVFITGFINAGGTLQDCGPGKDFCTIKYSPTGEEKWVSFYNGTGGIGRDDDVAKAVWVDSRGRIYVAGESMGDETGIDYCLIRYSEFFPAEETSIRSKSDTFRLNDNFPNPFNPSTKISFNVPSQSNVKLAIYDIEGKEVQVVVNDILQPGVHQFEWNASQYPSGAYFYKIQSEGFV